MEMTGRDAWNDGAAYERYMGRWSRPAAVRFLDWLDLPPGLAWLDVGCGTGALSETICRRCDPARILGVDPSAAQVDYARRSVADPRVRFEIAGADRLPATDGEFEVVVSGLVLNLVPDVTSALHEMRRATLVDGTIGGYVWDYAAGMGMIRRFWDAAMEVDPTAAALDGSHRFPICQPAALVQALEAAGLRECAVRGIEYDMEFSTFETLWAPLRGGQGPVPAYLASRSEKQKAAIARSFRGRLTPREDGHIVLPTRAWAFRGVRGSDSPPG
jgi:trans-aconitate methyltransferase